MSERKILCQMLINYDERLKELAVYFSNVHYDLNNEECRDVDRRWKINYGALIGVKELALRLGVIDKHERYMFTDELIEKLEAE